MTIDGFAFRCATVAAGVARGKDDSEEVRGSCRVGWGEKGEELVLYEAGILNSALCSSFEPSKVREDYEHQALSRCAKGAKFKFIF